MHGVGERAAPHAGPTAPAPKAATAGSARHTMAADGERIDIGSRTTNAASRIFRVGDGTDPARVPQRGAPEVQRITQRFNAMVQRLGVGGRSITWRNEAGKWYR